MSALPLPTDIYSGAYKTGHCQGIAVDLKNGWIYYAFTTMLVKTDLSGRFLGSAKGLLGHLGCIAFCADDGCVYGSLEYKNDSIGQGIRSRAGLGDAGAGPDAFYLVRFDGKRIDRADMDAARDGVMTAMFLREVTDDYLYVSPAGQRHRYGCSGIDGLTIVPPPGEPDARPDRLLVAYGVYGDVDRDDNDHQVLLAYPLADMDRFAAPLDPDGMHRSGPEKPLAKYFVHTGNTVYGVQNLEYDRDTGLIFAAVYAGQKPAYPNPPMFVIDYHKGAAEQTLRGIAPPETGLLLPLDGHGYDGLPFPYGSTGLASLGGGYFAVSHEGWTEAGDDTHVRLYRYGNGTFTQVTAE